MCDTTFEPSKVQLKQTQFAHLQIQVPLQQPIAILGHPHKVFDLIFRMTAFTISHLGSITQPFAESDPLSKTGVLAQTLDE